MSGPKVIRIVTLDEVLDTCAGHLARVDSALEDWTSVGKRNDCLDQAAVREVQARRAELDRMLAAGEHLKLQKAAPVIEQWLRDDLTSRLNAVANEQATARSRERRTIQSAQMILAELQRTGAQAEPSMLERLRASAAGAPDHRAVSQALRALAAGTAREQTVSATVLESLKDDAPRQPFEHWHASAASTPPQPAQAALERQIAELSTLDAAPAAQFSAELDAASAISHRRERNLALDALSVRVGRALTARRQLATQRSALRASLAELAVLDEAAATALGTKVESAAVEELRIIAQQVASRVSLARETRAASARRSAVLQQLAQLGYQVTTGMSAAWVESGRVVIEKPTTPGYGVEVSGGSANGRIQVRAVAFDDGSTPYPSLDRDAEVLWCSDVTAMQTGLHDLGGGLIIERATPVGVTPLKRTTADRQRRSEAPASRRRERPIE